MDEIASRATILNVSYFKHILFQSISKFIFRIQTTLFEVSCDLHPAREICFYGISSIAPSINNIYLYHNQNEEPHIYIYIFDRYGLE